MSLFCPPMTFIPVFTKYNFARLYLYFPAPNFSKSHSGFWSFGIAENDVADVLAKKDSLPRVPRMGFCGVSWRHPNF